MLLDMLIYLAVSKMFTRGSLIWHEPKIMWSN